MTKLLCKLAGFRISKTQARRSVIGAVLLSSLVCFGIRPCAAALVGWIEFIEGWL